MFVIAGQLGLSFNLNHYLLQVKLKLSLHTVGLNVSKTANVINYVFKLFFTEKVFTIICRFNL